MSYKRGLAVVIACVVAALVSFAATYPRFHPAAPAGSVTAAGAAQPAKNTAPEPEPTLAVDLGPLHKSGSPLAWSRLTAAQRTALAPFAAEWDRFSEERQRKWLKIASRYPKLSPEAQKRLQERMTEWVRMTPEQRRVARENYQVSKELPPQARQRAWKAYQQLSEDQKERLAASEHKRRTVVSAPPSGETEIRDIERLVDERERRSAPHAPASAPAAHGTAASAPPSPATAESPAASSPVPATPVHREEQPDTSSIFKGS